MPRKYKMKDLMGGEGALQKVSSSQALSECIWSILEKPGEAEVSRKSLLRMQEILFITEFLTHVLPTGGRVLQQHQDFCCIFHDTLGDENPLPTPRKKQLYQTFLYL